MHPPRSRSPSFGSTGAGYSSERRTNPRVASPTNGVFRLFKPPANDATFHGRPPTWVLPSAGSLSSAGCRPFGPSGVPILWVAAVGPPDLNLLRPLMIPTEGLAVVASRPPASGSARLAFAPHLGPLGFNRLVGDLSPIASFTSPSFRVRSVSRWTTRPQLRPT